MKIISVCKGPRALGFIRLFVALLALATPLRIAAANVGDSILPLNLQLAPSAPGFVLLGVEPATVERPGSVADWATSIANATDNLTALPSNYALQVAPFWVTQAARNLTFNEYSSGRHVGDNCLQTLSLSVATGALAKTPGTALGIGVRFSPWRGDADTVFRRSVSLAQKALNKHLNALIDDSLARDTALRRLETVPEKDRDSAQVEQRLLRMSAIKVAIKSDTQRYSQALARVKNVATSIPLLRFGWKLDVAGGFVLNFPSSVYDSAEFGKSGVWLTGGYEDRDFSLLGTTRLLTGPMPTDTTSLDFGARLTLPASGKIEPSVEVVYRPYPAPTPLIAQRLRYNLVFAVPIGSSKAISVTLGRDFGSSENAKMILLLNLLMGFGTNRPASGPAAE